MFCFHLVFDDISSDDALQLMLTSPTYFHLEGTAVLTCVGAFECDCRHDAPNIWKNPSSRTPPTPGPTIIDKKKTPYISYYIIHKRCMNAFRHLQAMVRKYQICTSRHIGRKQHLHLLLLELLKI